MKERKKSWKRIVLTIVMCLSILIPNNLVYAASENSASTNNSSEYFKLDDKIAKLDETNILNSLESIKDEAIKDIEQYKANDENLYGKNEWRYIGNYKRICKGEILKAESEDEIKKSLKVAKGRIDREKTIEQTKKYNQEKANEVIEKIRQLQSAKTIDKVVIEELRKSYNNLNKSQKELVTNYDDLIDMEKKLLEIDKIGYFYLSMEKTTIGQGYLVKPVKVPYCKGDNLGGALVRYFNINKIDAETGYENYGQFYLSTIVDHGKLEAEFPEYIKEYAEKNGIKFSNPRKSSELGQFDYSQFSGWVFTVDNAHSPVGASGVKVKDGMVVRWAFTVVGLGSDCWNTGWGDPIIPVTIDKSNVIKAIADFDSNPEKEELLKDNGVKEAYNTLFADSLNWKADQNVLDNSTSQLSEAIKAAEKKKAEAEELAVAKEKAVAEIENYKNANDYREEQQKELAEKVSAAKEAINNAENKEAVAEFLKASKSGIDTIKTDAQLNTKENKVVEKLENNKEEISDKDNEKENNIPKTGDGQEVELMLMLGLLSLAGFYATHNRRKKNNA